MKATVTCRTWRSLPWVAASATAVSALLSFGVLGAPASSALSRAGVEALELHRLWTGHLVHYGAAHFYGDWLAFLVWSVLLEARSRRSLVLTLLAGTPLLSLALLAACPSVHEYRGLSGLDCALVVELFVLRARAGNGWAFVALAAFVAKCVLEAVLGRALLAPELGRGVELLPAAHWLGVALGVAVLFALHSPRVRAAWLVLETFRAPRSLAR